jgi:hypothetical protein
MIDAMEPIDWTGRKKVNLALQGGGSHGAFTWACSTIYWRIRGSISRRLPGRARAR